MNISSNNLRGFSQYSLLNCFRRKMVTRQVQIIR